MKIIILLFSLLITTFSYAGIPLNQRVIMDRLKSFSIIPTEEIKGISLLDNLYYTAEKGLPLFIDKNMKFVFRDGELEYLSKDKFTAFTPDKLKLSKLQEIAKKNKLNGFEFNKTKCFKEIDLCFIEEKPYPIYFDNNLSYLYSFGQLISTDIKREDIGMKLQLEVNKGLYKKLTVLNASALKRNFGNGSSEHFIVIEDPDCPGCSNLEYILREYKDPTLNATLYIFPYALSGIHPDADRKNELIWCSGNKRLEAWDKWFQKGILPDENKSCDKTKFNEYYSLLKSYGIDSTPTFLFSNGNLIKSGIHPNRYKLLIEALKKDK